MEAGRREVSVRARSISESVAAQEHPTVGHSAEVSARMSGKSLHTAFERLLGGKNRITNAGSFLQKEREKKQRKKYKRTRK